MNEDEKLPHIRDYIGRAYNYLSRGISLLVHRDEISDEDIVKVYEKMFAIDDIVFDGKENPDGWRTGRMHTDLAAVYARLGDRDKAFGHLKIAADAARKFDDRPDSGTYSSLLLGECSWKSTDFETSDSRSVCGVMAEKWLASEDFDSLRDTEEFRNIVRSLR